MKATGMAQEIKFKPRFGPEVLLKNGDNCAFQRSGKNEDGIFEMYNDSFGVNLINGKLSIEHNGTQYEPYEFLYCDNMDGDYCIDYITITLNYYDDAPAGV